MARFLDNIGLAYFWEKIKAWIPFLSRKTQSIPFGQVDSTSTSTVFTATVDGITELRDGVCCYLRNGVITSASGFTININGLGAKPVYNTMASSTAFTTQFNVNYTMLFIYNSTRVSGGCWDMYVGYDTNSTYNLNVNYTTIGRINVGAYPISAYSLCAFDVNDKLTPFVTAATTSTGKTLVSSTFPVGAKIYASNYSMSADTAQNDLGAILTTVANYDLRYSSVNHNVAIFPNSTFNRIFMPVLVNVTNNTFTLTTQTTNGYTNNFTNERSLMAGNFYIDIGFNGNRSYSYYYTLIQENRLYYYDGKNLIDYYLYKTQLVNADLSNKADKVVGATSGNFAGLDATGNLTDSGCKPSDFLTQHQHLPEYTIEKLTQAETSYSASYVLKKDNVQVGATINIPKDMVVSSGEVKTVTTANVPYQGAQVGDKYIDLTIANTSQNHIYIPVKDLVDVYVAGNGIRISDNNYISIVVDSNNANGLGVGGSGLALYHVTPSVNGSGGSDGAMLATDKEKLDGIEAGAEENVIETVKVSGTALQVTDKAVNIVTETAYDPTTNKIATMSDVEGATPNVGHLNTNNTTAQTPSASESFTGDINLHKVAKTGSYNDLNDQPTIPSSGDFVTSLGTSGNNVTWTKNGVTNNLTVPYATNAGTAAKIGTSTVGASNKPIYLNAGVPTAISSFPEAYLSWGGRNLSSTYAPIDAAMVSELGACRTMFAKAAGITIEYSTDAGTTWLDYGATDAQKIGLFSSGQSFYIGKSSTSGASSTNYMLRVSLLTSQASIYTTLNKFVIFISTNGSTGCYCTIKARTQENYENDVDTWRTFADAVLISGWSGYNVINTDGLTTYGNTKSSQYGQIQFIFGCTNYSGSSTGLSISRIFGFGGVGWVTPSNMAKTGHLYSYNSLQDATFPSNVTAAKFIKSGGTSSQFLKADGSVDSNTYATTSQLPSLPLSIANGGTGATTAKAAEYNLTPNLGTEITSEFSDTGMIPCLVLPSNTTNGRFYGYRTMAKVWNYIKSKIASVLGIGGSNGVPTAPTAAAGTNTTQIATTAFVNSATSGFAIDDEVVHKAGAETITGEKTFEANVNLTEGATLNMVYDSQTPDGVYLQAAELNGLKTVSFSGISDDGMVQIKNVYVPTNDTDAANKYYVDEEILDIDEYRVYLACKYGPYGVHQKSLCAFCLTNGGKEMMMTSFTKTSGTAAKEVITDLVFPIGCKIYYNDASSDSQANLSSMANRYYTSFNGVDVRYSAITGTSISLGNYPTETQSTVYLHVIVENGYWKPYYKEGATNEIIVDSYHMQSGNFYIYLGKTVRNTGYMIQLEDNNPLYYYDGTKLVDWVSYLKTVIELESSQDMSTKADKVSEASSGNLAGLDYSGNLTDSGLAADEVATLGTNQLTNYYKKTEIYSKSETDELIRAASDFEYVEVSTLPTASASTKGKFYLYNGHRYVTTEVTSGVFSWIDLGSYDIDLSNYVTNSDFDAELATRPTYERLDSEAQMQSMINNHTWVEGVIYYTVEED